MPNQMRPRPPTDGARTQPRQGRQATSLERGGPAGSYQRLGFTPTGEVDQNGEVIMRLAMPQRRTIAEHYLPRLRCPT